MLIITINDAIINKLYDYEGEKRTISYFLLNKNEVKIDTNNNLINDYYLDNKSNYLIPEKTIIDFIEVNINDFKRKENINTVKLRITTTTILINILKKKAEIFNL